MPGKVKVKIIAGRNLPVMDRSSDTTDAYVEIKLGNTTYKTDVCRKSLNPQWNSEWYRFEVDDSELQDEPLQIRLMDHDTYSANDAIGKVYLNLNPLLIPAVAIPSKYGWSSDANVDQPSSSMMSGWIPVYDTMHGIRGEVNVTVKVELFSDFNKFRQSSCGVHFFCSPVIPHGYHAQVIHGFIEELVVNDDPEYQWIDKIRTPRASNEARQTLFFKLSGELQRKIGVKALDLGGNAVIGYNQCFDLEGESGIVARGIGTVVTLIKHHEMHQQLTDIGIAEEKALSYLKFLAFDNGLKLESDNKFECLSLSQKNPKPISSSLFINPPMDEQIIRRSPRRNIPLFIRQSSQPLIQLDYHSPILKPCISSQSLSDDIKEEIALRQLIQQEDMRNGSISSTSLTRRMRYLKQNILTKKMIALKEKLSDTTMPEHLDFASTSIQKETAPIRTSLIDLRELRKKKKSRMHQNNSSYMAELLVRSVMHAHTSLDCILECHDTGPTLSSSTSKLNEDHGECSSMQTSESKKTVLESDPIGGLMTKTISEPYLLLPDNTIVTQSSNASSDSDVSSSSDVSESPSDSKEEKMDFDTVSLIVKNVQQEEEIREFKEKREHCGQLHFSFLDPPIHTSHILPKTDFDVEGVSSIIEDVQNYKDPIEKDEVQENIIFDLVNERIEEIEDIQQTLEKPIVGIEEIQKILKEPIVIEEILNIVHEPFVGIEEILNIVQEPIEIQETLEDTEIKTEDTPSPLPTFNKNKLNSLFRSHALNISFDVPATAPVYLEDRKEVFTFPVDIDKKIEKLSHSALFNHSFRMHGLKRGKLQKGFSRSCEDISAENKEEETSEKTGMHLFKQTTSNDFGETEKKRKCFAECAQQTFSQSNPNVSNIGLLSTAINTMLMEKIDIMTPEPAPVSPKIKKELKAPWNHKSNDAGNNSLMKTAMQTMLIEKVNLMSPVGAPVSRRAKEQLQLQSSVSKSFSKSDPDLHSHSLLKSAIDTIHKVHLPHHIFHHKTKKLQKTMSQSHPELLNANEAENEHHSTKEKFMDKIHFITHVIPHHHKSKEFDHEQASNKSINSETKEHHTVKEKLMDKIHFITHAIPHHHHKTKELHEAGHVTTRRHTHHGKTLSTSHPDLTEHHSVKEKFMDKIHFITQAMPHPHLHHHHKHNNTNLVKETSKSHPDLRDQEKHNHASFSEKIHALKSPITPKKKKEKSHVSTESNLGHHSLVKTAMQTMLLDKVNILTSNSPPTSPNAEEEFEYGEPSVDLPEESQTPTSSNCTSIKTELDLYENSTQVSELDNQSLVKTAMATMLMDKINILTPTSPMAHKEEFNFDDRKQSIKHEHPNLDKIKTVVHSVIDKVHHLTPSSSKSEKEFNFDAKKHDDSENQSLMKSAMQTMLLDKVQILNPNSPTPEFEEPFFNTETPNKSEHHHHHKKENDELENHSLVKTAMQTMLLEKANIVAPETSNISEISEDPPDMESNRKSDVEKKSSFFGSLKKKCKNFKMPSPRKSFTKLIHKKDSHKDKSDGLVESAMTTMLLDRVNNIQGTITSHEDPTIQCPDSSIPKAFSKQTIDDLPLALPSAEEPNINMRLDNGVTYNNGTPAITSNDANCNTNAEHVPCLYTSDRRIVESPIPERERETSTRERHGHQRTESTGGKMSQSPARLNAIPCIHRRSSDSDLSITPKVGINRKRNSLTGSDRSGGAIPGYHHIRSTLLRPTVDNFDMMEYPFLTMSKYPPGFILHLGGAVSARSVKLLERITNIEEPETRDTWWSELRMEIRTHARALNCNAVLGYQESTSICDEVCVLSAAGTAAVIALYSGELSDGVSGLPNLHKPHIPNKDLMTSSLDRTDFERDSKTSKHVESSNTNNKITESPEHEATIEFSGSTNQQTPTACRICHIPYSESSMSFRINMLYCSICKLAKVPDIILATIEMPEGLPITGRGCFLQSYVCRPKRDLKGELNAKEISESLPFLEYELHRLLVNKMKVKAMNTIFGLKVRITIGERMLVGIATGTAVFLLPLPPPPLPKLIAGNATTEDKKLSEMQKLLVDTVKKNKEIYELKDQDFLQNTRLLSDTEESDDEKSNIDLSAGNKDSCVLEVDDSEDIEVINLLVEPRPPDGFHVVNTENVPGLEELEIVRNLQMFTQVWRTKIPLNQSVSHFGKHFQKILQSVYFKLRRMIPCALCDLQFRVDLPEPDEIQLTLLGMALGLGDPMKLNKFKRKNLSILPTKELTKKSDDELIFSLEEDHIPENSVPVICQSGLLNPQVPKHRQKSPQRLRMNPKQRHTPIKERHGVDITPLSYVPGGKIERYLGYLNFFFIRETTSIREGGGLSGFVHSFITEVLAIVRAHVTALGGNAMVAYFMTECVLCHNAHKNQGQCLINVGGDVVFVSYFTEDN